MELDQILQLIDKVSDSSLTAFDYEADGIKIAMEHGKQLRSGADEAGFHPVPVCRWQR